jgi:hypothetical protein
MTMPAETFSSSAIGTVAARSRIALAATLGLWLAAVVAGGAFAAFEAAAGQPPLGVMLAIAVPPLLFALLYRLRPGFRAFALGIDLRWLTAIQAWRVIGVMFLALYAFGLLPGLFAWPAGLGDAAVGVAAPFVLLAILRGAPGWRRQVFWLNIAGLIDFAAAIGTGVLASNSSLGLLADGRAYVSLGELPLSLVPTFAVPLWIIFHLISLLQLRRGVANRASDFGDGPVRAGQSM